MNIRLSVLYTLLFCWQVGTFSALQDVEFREGANTPLLKTDPQVLNDITASINTLERELPKKYDSSDTVPIKTSLAAINGLRNAIDAKLDAIQEKNSIIFHKRLDAIQNRIIKLIEQEVDRIKKLDTTAQLQEEAFYGMYKAMTGYITLVGEYTGASRAVGAVRSRAAQAIVDTWEALQVKIDTLRDSSEKARTLYDAFKESVDNDTMPTTYQEMLSHEKTIQQFDAKVSKDCASLTKRDCADLQKQVKELLATIQKYRKTYEGYVKKIDDPVSLLGKLQRVDTADALRDLTNKIADDALLSDQDKKELIKKISSKTGESMAAGFIRGVYKDLTLLAAVAERR